MKLFNSSVLLAAISTVALYAQPSIAEQSNDLTLGLTTDFNSDYIWRGLNLYDGTSIQPALDAKYNLGDMGTIGLNVWSHLSAEGGQSSAEKFTEIDYTAHWDISMDAWSFSLGHIWYQYPRDSDGIEDSAELFASVSYDTMLKPTLKAFHDYDQYDNQYYELGFSHAFETSALGDGFKTTPFVAIGFADNAEKVYADESGVTHVAIGTSFDFQTGDLTVTPNLNYNIEVDDATQNEFWVGVRLGYALM